MRVDESPVVVEHAFSQSALQVWRALTEPQQMRQWYFENIPGFNAQVGFATEFAIKSASKTFTHRWRVLEVEPCVYLQYQWNYTEYAGDAEVSFRIQKLKNTDKERTKLTVRMKVLRDFPDDVEEFQRASCLAGWEFLIQQQLADYLTQSLA